MKGHKVKHFKRASAMVAVIVTFLFITAGMAFACQANGQASPSCNTSTGTRTVTWTVSYPIESWSSPDLLLHITKNSRNAAFDKIVLKPAETATAIEKVTGKVGDRFENVVHVLFRDTRGRIRASQDLTLSVNLTDDCQPKVGRWPNLPVITCNTFTIDPIGWIKVAAHVTVNGVSKTKFGTYGKLPSDLHNARVNISDLTTALGILHIAGYGTSNFGFGPVRSPTVVVTLVCHPTKPKVNIKWISQCAQVRIEAYSSGGDTQSQVTIISATHGVLLNGKMGDANAIAVIDKLSKGNDQIIVKQDGRVIDHPFSVHAKPIDECKATPPTHKSPSTPKQSTPVKTAKTLPLTGSSSLPLGFIGLAILAAGVVALVKTSRRQEMSYIQ